MAKDFFKDLCTDKTLEAEGAWVYLPDFEGSVKVARWNNQKYQQALAAELKPYRRYVDKRGAFKPDTPESVKQEMEQITIRATAEHVLLDIKDFHADGQPISNTVENKARMLRDDDFFAQVQEAALYRKTFRAEEREQEAKNSKKPSAGGSTTPQETRKAS
jgi:hypothetical protein